MFKMCVKTTNAAGEANGKVRADLCRNKPFLGVAADNDAFVGIARAARAKTVKRPAGVEQSCPAVRAFLKRGSKRM
jgi:hypothetical protein